MSGFGQRFVTTKVSKFLHAMPPDWSMRGATNPISLKPGIAVARKSNRKIQRSAQAVPAK